MAASMFAASADRNEAWATWEPFNARAVLPFGFPVAITRNGHTRSSGRYHGRRQAGVHGVTGAWLLWRDALHCPLDRAAVTITLLCLADREWIVLPDAKLDQLVADDRRHIHDSLIDERVHHLSTISSFNFHTIGIRECRCHWHVGLKHDFLFHWVTS